MNEKHVRITLRLPPSLHAQAVELAKQMDRSLNWEMVHLMQIGVSSLAPKTRPRARNTEEKEGA